MNEYIIALIIFIIGLIIGYVVFGLPKVKQRITLDEYTKKENESLVQENNILHKQNLQLDKTNIELTVLKDQLTNTANELKESNSVLTAQKEEIKKSLTDLEEQATKSAELIYKDKLQLAQNAFEVAMEKMSKKSQEWQESCKQEYLNTSADLQISLTAEIDAYNHKIEEFKQLCLAAQQELDTMRAKSDAAIEAYKREEERMLDEDKYKILLSEQDLSEIAHLKSVIPYLRNARPVAKMIWEGYYRTPAGAMITRILEDSSASGIYKITNIRNNMCYIGQAANLSDRLKQHIKCGLGIDTPVNNKLYAAMLKEGLETFKFEILEICDRADLNNREKFWIDFYQCQDWGYNITSGGAKNYV